jgi:hypothetical protein
MKSPIALIFTLLLTGCASYSGHGLQPGVSRIDDVERLMGPPAMRWKETDGGETLAYPRGPSGYHTYIASVNAQGTLTSLMNVLEPKRFALLREGMTQEEVMRIIGPPFPGWTMYFSARDELVWEWRWCDDWGEPARFNALFDGTSGKLRSTASLTERQSMPFGQGDRRAWCSR